MKAFPPNPITVFLQRSLPFAMEMLGNSQGGTDEDEEEEWKGGLFLRNVGGKNVSAKHNFMIRDTLGNIDHEISCQTELFLKNVGNYWGDDM